MDDAWKWIGFTRRDPAKLILINHFIETVDYKIVHHQTIKKSTQYLMTVNTFKKFCLMPDTREASDVRNYYIKLEKLLQEIINNESSELKSIAESAGLINFSLKWRYAFRWVLNTIKTS